MSQNKYYAHTATNLEDWEPLKEHLLNVAKRSRQFAAAFDMGDEAYLAGLLHDFGKYGERFQDRLKGIGKHIDHWTPGAWAALKQYGSSKGRCLALLAQGHHIGLQQDHANCLKKIGRSEPSPGTTLSADSMNGLLHLFEAEELSWPILPASFYNRTGKWCSDMLDIRMLFSSLVDADFLETEKFVNRVEGKQQRPSPIPFNPASALEALYKHIATLPKKGSADVMEIRATLFKACCKAGNGKRSVYTLSAPTGSGKTFSMLAFALQHAREHSLERVIVVLPFLNVIEQTAKDYRNVFKDFPEGFVIEHHSLAGTKRSDKDDDNRERLLAENWDAPIIITSNVQFLESLFANRPSACRKLHNIANSVVLFDEVQTLPPELTIHTLAALSRLAERYCTSIVFATATQPAFSHLDYKTRKWCVSGWQPQRILPVETEVALFTKGGRRVRYQYIAAPLSWDSLAEQILADGHRQVLCVVNTKKQAIKLTECLRNKLSSCDQNAVFHFSTNMCAAHRRDCLKTIKERLNPESPLMCYLVSTQCIEAGVDISFPVVYRAWAPLEAIVQTAGRCNRNNELFPEMGICYVFMPVEASYPTGFYENATATTRAFISGLGDDQKLYLDDPAVIERYYQKLYDFLGHTEPPKELCSALENADFVDVAQRYRLIKQDTVNLVVPYKTGQSLIEDVWEKGLSNDWIRRAQLYAVSVYRSGISEDVRDIMCAAPIFKQGERFASEDWFICASTAEYSELTGLPASGKYDRCVI